LHTTRLTLVRGADWVEIEDLIEANFTDVRTWGFDFRMTEPDVWHEEVGAVLRARPASVGGHYADRNARVDWLSLGHFAQMIGREAGVTLANADCAFFRLGKSSVTRLDTSLPHLAVLAGGQVDGPGLGMLEQGGDRQFTQRFAVRPGLAKADPLAAMQWSLQWQNPLVAGPVTGTAARSGYPADTFSLWQNSDPHIVLWALKPAEEGLAGGVIARAWNLSKERVSTRWTMPGLQAAHAVTHIETDESPLTVREQGVTLDFAPQQMRTARLLLDKPIVSKPARTIQIQARP
jgi:alpha-mannosidase